MRGVQTPDTIRLPILLIVFLAVMVRGISVSVAQDAEISVPPSVGVTILSSDMDQIATWLRSGQYLQEGNTTPQLSFEAWPDDSAPFVSTMMDQWRYGRGIEESSEKEFCLFVRSKINSWESSSTAMEEEIVEAASYLIEDYDAYDSLSQSYSLYTAELQSAIAGNRDRHPALPVLEGALASIVQLEAELPLLRESLDACRSGAMVVEDMLGMGIRNSFNRTGVNQLLQTLALSGVSDFTFRGSKLGKIDFSNMELGKITIENAEIAGLDFTNSILSSLTIEDSVMAQCFTADQCDGRFVFENATVSDSVEFSNLDVFGYLYLGHTKIGGDMRISGVNINRPESTRLRLAEHFGFENVEIESFLTANRIGERNEESRAISLFAATVGGSTTIIDSEIEGLVHLGRSRHGELRIAGTHIDGKLDLWGSTISGPAFIGHDSSRAKVPGVTITGEFHAWYANFDDLQIGHVWIRGNLTLQHARIDGALIISNSEFRGALALNHARIDGALVFNNSDFRGWVRAESLRLNSISITNVAASHVDMRGSRINGEFQVEGSHIARLDLTIAQMRGLSFMDALDLGNVMRPKAECLALPTSDSTVPRFGTAKTFRESTISHRRPNCTGIIDAHSIVVENGIYLSGYVESRIDLTQSQIKGSTVLSGKAIAYGMDSCVLMRDADLQSIILDSPGGDTDEAARTAPLNIDTHGAQFKIIRASDPVSFGDRNQAAHALIDVFKKKDGKICTKDGLKVDKSADAPEDTSTGTPTDTSTDQPADTPHTKKNSSYMPGLYDGLARGYEAAGDIDMARIVKIEKNRAYAAALPDMDQSTGVVLERAVYFISDKINGFGYRNLNAVFWLMGLILTGYVLSWIAAKRAQRTIAPVGAIDLAVSRTAKVDQPSLNRFMFSLDRAIPTLALDTTFGTHSGIPMPTWLSVWFYIQRIACFLIVILILAGAFEVFQ